MKSGREKEEKRKEKELVSFVLVQGARGETVMRAQERAFSRVFFFSQKNNNKKNRDLHGKFTVVRLTMVYRGRELPHTVPF